MRDDCRLTVSGLAQTGCTYQFNGSVSSALNLFAKRHKYLQSVKLEEPVPMISMNPVQYIQQVRAEVAKVVWPTRKEVLLTTVMVFVMSAVTAVFFAVVDILIRGGLQTVLGAFG